MTSIEKLISNLSTDILENVISVYISAYNEGPFKGNICMEFLICLKEKQLRNEIE